MPRIHANNQLELSRDEYDGLYRGVPMDGVELSYATWDIGEPQQQVVQWFQAGHFTGPVLDAGCGTGPHAVYLAEQGLQVTGFDFSPTAVEAARARARSRGLTGDNPQFVVADATALDLPGSYATVLDRGLYHCLPEEHRLGYLTSVRRVAAPDGRLLLICFADVAPEGLPGPFKISKAELERLMPEAGWEIVDLQLGTHQTRYVQPDLQRVADRAGTVPGADVSELPLNDAGQVLMPSWTLIAKAADR